MEWLSTLSVGQIWKTLREHSKTIEGKGQLIMQAFAKVRTT